MSEATMTAEQKALWQQVVAKAWADPAFKTKLMADPAGALAGLGVTLPAGLAVHVHEATPTAIHLILPPRPADELDDEALEGVTGGTGSTHHSSSHGSSSHHSSSIETDQLTQAELCAQQALADANTSCALCSCAI